MRKLLPVGSRPLLLLSFISAVTLGSYILWKLGLKAWKSGSSGKEAQAEKTDDVISPFAPQPPNGTVFVKPEAPCLVPLTVEVKDANSYYIFLKFIKAPENAVSADWHEPGNTGCSDIGFFAAADSSVSLNVPAGVYNLTYASGKAWCGLTEKFGPDTRYYKANETLTFFKDRNRLYGNTIQLLPQSESDALSRQIDPSDFPG